MALLVSTPARANGRYPLAGQIVIDPADPDHIVARATFGLLDSDDGGKTFRWICETAIGYFGVEDPPVGVTANGSAIVASSKGISVSADGGCSWIRNPGLMGTWFGVDVTVQPSRPHEALALLSNLADGAYTVSIARTVDDGASWEQLGSPLGTNFLATTIEVAPSDPDRIYVSGKSLSDGSTVILRSKDGGHTFETLPLDLTGTYAVFIGAVDPHDPDVIYVRTNADDIGRVLVSSDGATTFREVWQAPDDVSGFALSPDGTTVAVGASSVGVSVASTTDFAFRKTSNAGVYCLTFWGDKLLVCTKEAIDHFSIGVSDDLGEHFQSLLHLSDVLPRACSRDASAAACALDWPATATTIGADAGSIQSTDGGAEEPTTARGCGCNLAATRRDPTQNTWYLVVIAGAHVIARRLRRSARVVAP